MILVDKYNNILNNQSNIIMVWQQSILKLYKPYQVIDVWVSLIMSTTCKSSDQNRIITEWLLSHFYLGLSAFCHHILKTVTFPNSNLLL